MTTQEQKELLLKDLCARLQYGVKVLCLKDFNRDWYNLEAIDISKDEVYITSNYTGEYTNRYSKIVEVKPYLFPLSSITDEQMVELKNLCNMFTPDGDYEPRAYWGIKVIYKYGRDGNYKFDFKTDVIDWFHKNHIDYRGLIPMGLANDATWLNIY